MDRRILLMQGVSSRLGSSAFVFFLFSLPVKCLRFFASQGLEIYIGGLLRFFVNGLNYFEAFIHSFPFRLMVLQRGNPPEGWQNSKDMSPKNARWLHLIKKRPIMCHLWCPSWPWLPHVFAAWKHNRFDGVMLLEKQTRQSSRQKHGGDRKFRWSGTKNKKTCVYQCRCIYIYIRQLYLCICALLHMIYFFENGDGWTRFLFQNKILLM